MTISKRYFNAATAWAKADGEARELEALKDITLHQTAKQVMKDHEETHGVVLSLAAAEREVKASDAWQAFIAKMVAARTRANHDRAEMDTLMMEHEAEHGRTRIALERERA